MKLIKKNHKWESRWLDLAAYYSTWSKDPSTKVGAIIVDPQQRMVSMGYNGMPQGLINEQEYLSERELKYQTVIHAEVNALIFAKQDVSDCTLYTFPFLPCSVCMSIFLQAGIKTFVAPVCEDLRWQQKLETTRKLASDFGPNINIMEVEWV